MDFTELTAGKSKGVVERSEAEKGKEKITALIPLRIKPSEKEKLQSLADKKGLPLSTFIRSILIKYEYI